MREFTKFQSYKQGSHTALKSKVRQNRKLLKKSRNNSAIVDTSIANHFDRFFVMLLMLCCDVP